MTSFAGESVAIMRPPGHGGRNPPGWWYMARLKGVKRPPRTLKALYFQQTTGKQLFGTTFASNLYVVDQRGVEQLC